MTTNNPITVDGKTYDELGLALVISPLFKPDFLSASVVMKLTPLRREDGQIEQLTDAQYQKTLVVSDAFAQNDPDFLTALAKIQGAVQDYINAKNL